MRNDVPDDWRDSAALTVAVIGGATLVVVVVIAAVVSLVITLNQSGRGGPVRPLNAEVAGDGVGGAVGGVGVEPAPAETDRSRLDRIERQRLVLKDSVGDGGGCWPLPAELELVWWDEHGRVLKAISMRGKQLCLDGVCPVTGRVRTSSDLLDRAVHVRLLDRRR